MTTVIVFHALAALNDDTWCSHIESRVNQKGELVTTDIALNETRAADVLAISAPLTALSLDELQLDLDDLEALVVEVSARTCGGTYCAANYTSPL